MQRDPFLNQPPRQIMALCGICNEAPSKYKCPSCEIPYCSLVCYKPHKVQHEKAKLAEPTSAAPKAAEKAQDDEPEPAPKPIETGKFASLLSSPEVQQMLASPSLRQHLLSVHKATLEPPPQNFVPRGRGGRGRGRGGRGGFEQTRRPWNEERAVKAGVGELKRLREDNTEVDEFVNLVIGIVDPVKVEE
ncbi:uncharacterized protein H6S33_009097 [Morchella sextelata]|uniref:uncharacterized protein n=1 Tax=Morchella sextelata TaxID=1174677 RepID=UPI001D04F50B|nr:uncharacterized protein H6S33_009097 [Morchella sextelata]KAH0612717.1 hypothetical protein H6S33_009097 [Morchella sextelata]